LPSLVRHANNFNIWKNLRDGFPHPYTEESGAGWLKMVNSEPRNLILAIEIDGEAAGSIGIIFKDDVYRITAEIGYWLSEQHWGKGLMTEAVNLLVGYVFANYPEIMLIYAEIFSYNPASGKVLEKCGFHLESIHKKAVFKNGQLLDEHRYVRFR